MSDVQPYEILAHFPREALAAILDEEFYVDTDYGTLNRSRSCPLHVAIVATDVWSDFASSSSRTPSAIRVGFFLQERNPTLDREIVTDQAREFISDHMRDIRNGTFKDRVRKSLEVYHGG